MEFEDNYEDNKKPAKNISNGKTDVLDNFCRDITKMAREGLIDPVIGREKEAKKLCQILARRVKSNAVLIGAAGVGKTAIINKLAQMISDGRAPKPLVDKKIYSLDLTSIVAGTKYRGQFEERMKAILDELVNNQNIIIFIDELHTIVGTGNSSGGLDVANIFKPALARGELQVIGATTSDEYRENIEKDTALTRRFQAVLIEEPSIDETIKILTGVKYKYEDFHGVEYSAEAIESCVKLSDRYIIDKYLPDKALDIMDSAGARTNIDFDVPSEIPELEKKRNNCIVEKAMAVRRQDFEKAKRIKDEEVLLGEQLAQAKKTWFKNTGKKQTIITTDMVAEIIHETTGIPIDKLSATENQKLSNIEKELSSKVIGQDEAVSKISKAIKRSRLGIKDKNKPISFMLLGPTGVGKCVYKDSKITIRNKKTNIVEEISIEELLERIKNNNLK